MSDQSDLLENIEHKVPAWAMPVPRNIMGWVDNFVRWISRNVLVGGSAIILIVLYNHFSAEAGFPTKEDTFAVLLSMLVLGISILMVHVDFDVIAQQYYETRTWYLKFVSFFIVPAGIVLAIVLAPSVQIEGTFIAVLPLSDVACVVFLACVVISYSAYIIKLFSRDNSMKDFLREVGDDYNMQMEKQAEAMKIEAAQTDEVDGVRV